MKALLISDLDGWSHLGALVPEQPSAKLRGGTGTRVTVSANDAGHLKTHMAKVTQGDKLPTR